MRRKEDNHKTAEDDDKRYLVVDEDNDNNLSVFKRKDEENAKDKWNVSETENNFNETETEKNFNKTGNHLTGTDAENNFDRPKIGFTDESKETINVLFSKDKTRNEANKTKYDDATTEDEPNQQNEFVFTSELLCHNQLIDLHENKTQLKEIEITTDSDVIRRLNDSKISKKKEKSKKKVTEIEVNLEEESSLELDVKDGKELESIEILREELKAKKKERKKKRKKKAKQVAKTAGRTMWKGLKVSWKLLWSGLAMFTLPIGSLDISANIAKTWNTRSTNNYG